MKRFITVFEFEFMNYIKNKSYLVTTILTATIIVLLMFLPNLVDLSDLLGIQENTQEQGTDDSKTKKKDSKPKDATTFGIVDQTGYLTENPLLGETFQDTEFLFLKDEKELKKAVTAEEVDAGFLVTDDSNYTYYVLNRDMWDENQAVFDSVLTSIHKQIYCQNNGLDYQKLIEEYEAPVHCDTKVLGKDAVDNYWYCYILVILIFMVIILYGVMIATSVTTEKSNRSIEVLVTSIDSGYLLFGKVLAGAAAVMVQLALIIGAALIGYAFNHDAWGNSLDMILDIPTNVMIAFAIFGMGGFLFYAFLYGALGALVSKTEDINKSVGPLQMIITLVYFAVMMQLQNPDGMIMKICSFLPFSSYSAMFVRISMGTVASWEVTLSAGILFLSILFVGWLSAKIYRMGTLRYGNPIKISNVLRSKCE